MASSTSTEDLATSEQPPPGKRARNEVPFPPLTFDAYYRELARDAADHEALLAAMRRPLPTAFRSAGSTAAIEATSAELCSRFGGVPQLQALGWHSNAWKLVCSRQELRSSEQLSSLHQWLVSRHEAGAVRRQEEASMLSVALLGAQPGDRIVDMCASPGSKSSELADQVGANGLLIANDNDLKRCWMLMHTMRRFPRPALVVTHHEAQKLPHLPGGVGFDRVLCDVPCSGDGTLRKARSHWERKGWKPTLGVSLQPLQLAIARRGLQVLKRGGHLLYSTCSLNPVENEAVVAALLAEGGCELLDVHSDGRLPAGTFKLRPGLSSWRVANVDHPHWRQGVPGRGTADAPLWFDSASDARVTDGPSARQLSSAVLYPPSTAPKPAAPDAEASRSAAAGDAAAEPCHLQQQLSRCGRLLPQDNDTGGFFVALFVKTADYIAPDDASAVTGGAGDGSAVATDTVGASKRKSEDADALLRLKKEGQLRAGGATSKNSNVPRGIQALASGAKGGGNLNDGSGSAEILTVADERFSEEMASIRRFYGLERHHTEAEEDSSDSTGVLLTRSAEEGVLHRVFWMSSAAASLAVLSRTYTVVGAGTAVFELTRARGADCRYRLCSDAAALWLATMQQTQTAPGSSTRNRTIWLGPRAWSALLHGPGSGTEAAMPLSVLLEAAAVDEAEGNSDRVRNQSPRAGPQALARVAAAAEAASQDDQSRVGVGAGCLLLRLREGNGTDEGACASPPRPETCVVGWLGLGGEGPTVMLFCAANDLAILRELY